MATAAFGVGAFVSIREYRLDRFREGAEREAELRVAAVIDGADVGADAMVEALDGDRTEVVVSTAGTEGTSDPGLGLGDIPAELTAPGAGAASAVTVVDGVSYLVVARPLPGQEGRVFFLFDRTALFGDIEELAEALALAWLVVTATAAAISTRVARRALWPVRRASDAAHDLANGLLGTRLPVEGADEFGAWAAAFNRMADELERRIARERRFTADVAHELRTPVGSSLAAASLLETQLDELPPDARRPAELIVQELRRLRRVVDDLLEISLLESGRDRLDLDDVELVERVRQLLVSRGWSTAVQLDGHESWIVSDPRRIDRIVANLVENAIHHGAPPVRIVVTATGREATVEVCDAGPGVPPEELATLFEPFFKRRPARAGPGSGLGLAIADHHARLLGGRLEATSRPGKTCFALVVPLVAGDGTGGRGR